MKNTVILDRRFVAEGAQIIKQGDFGNAAYLIQSGKIRIFAEVDGVKKILGDLGVGEIFGEMALISDGPRTASAEAIEDCNLIILSRQTVLKKVEETDATIHAIILMLMRRLEENNRRVLGIEKKVEQNWPAVFQSAYANMLESMNQADKYECQEHIDTAFEEFLGKLQEFFKNKSDNA